MRFARRTENSFIFLHAAAVSVSLALVIGLLALISYEGLGHFWPRAVLQIELQTDDAKSTTILGQQRGKERIPTARLSNENPTLEAPIARTYISRLLVKVGNRDLLGFDFRWINQQSVVNTTTPPDAVALERLEWGDAFGFVQSIEQSGQIIAEGEQAREELKTRIARVQELREQARALELGRINSLNYETEQLRLEVRGIELAGGQDRKRLAEITKRRSEIESEFRELDLELSRIRSSADRDVVLLRVSSGEILRQPIAQLTRAYWPNAMTLTEKLHLYGEKVIEFLTEPPREANTEGGIFPAIFGTMLMVITMSVLVTPLGVVAAVYMHEYAARSTITSLIRIAVNNLAGVPSIVYGVFGLGFFVYALGGSLDQLFYAEALPSPTFGTGGLFWAALTLALLTLPVVIVSTEEGLARVPIALRDGALALGATKLETLRTIILPIASPALLTGLILAIARAAGEVAPLMLVGVVKLAPSLAVDGNFPYLHLERKFMHLGFHIYDVGFQSPNVEAARPLVYATSLVLVLVIIALNLSAVMIRHRLRERFKESDN